MQRDVLLLAEIIGAIERIREIKVAHEGSLSCVLRADEVDLR